MRNYCIHCRALDTDEAGEGCKNPTWHIPSASSQHYQTTCEAGGHCKCYEDGMRCCTCRDRKV
jgi:hypothetical protein